MQYFTIWKPVIDRCLAHKEIASKEGIWTNRIKNKTNKNKSKTTFYIVFNAKTTLITPETMQRRMTVSEMAMAMVMSMPRTESM